MPVLYSLPEAIGPGLKGRLFTLKRIVQIKPDGEVIDQHYPRTDIQIIKAQRAQR